MRNYAVIAIVVGLLVTGLTSTARAQETKRTHTLVAEDYFTLASISDLATSPDGAQVAWVELRWDRPNDRRTADIWMVNRTTGKSRRLTFDPAFDTSPVWAPDGSAIYFLSGRKRGGEKTAPHDGKRQVWRIAIDGSEAQAVTRVPGGVAGFALSRSGHALYYLRSKKHVDPAFGKLRKQFAKLEYGHGVDTFHTVWKLDLETWRHTRLIDENRFIRHFAVSPDEQRIAMITDPRAELVTHEGWSRVDVWYAGENRVVTLNDRLWRKEAPSPYGWLSGFAWSADARALAFDVAFDGYPSELFVAEWAGDGDPRIHRLARPDEAHVQSESYAFRGSTRELCFLADHRAGVRLYAVADVTGAGQGASRVLSPDTAVVSHFGFSRSGDVLAASWSDCTQPGDIFALSAAGAPVRLTCINPQVDTWKLPVIRKVRWKGANGDPVEGILELPPGHRPGQPLPTIVELHGGPTSATRQHLRFWIYGRALMAARGYALLSPNYRGSVGYGDRFLTDLIGHENEIEVKDILAGVDHLVAEGIADPDRLGVMGWSNGGLLTNCLIGHSTRFKAASSGAGVLDMVLQWGEEDTPGHVINFMKGKLPWEDPEQYRHSSPIYRLGGVKTPTLIHVGGNDARCPQGHSRALFRALHVYLGVPTELVVYPGASHGLATYTHRLAKMKWDRAWFDRYLPADVRQ